MPTFTRPDGSTVEIAARDVARIRPTITNEIYEAPGHTGTALFLKPKQLVMETVDTVGPMLKAEVGSFISFNGLSGRTYWIDAAKAGQARPPNPITEAQPGINAVIPIGGTALKVAATVQDAQDAIDAAVLTS